MSGDMTFQVGDRVRILVEYQCNSGGLSKGCTGTIKKIIQRNYGVELDTYSVEAHKLDGATPSGYGWWFPLIGNYLELEHDIPYSSVIRKIRHIQDKRVKLGYKDYTLPKENQI